MEPARAAPQAVAGGARRRGHRRLAARRRGCLSGRGRQGRAGALPRQSEGPGTRARLDLMTSPILPHLVSDIIAGRIRVVDLTHALTPDFPPIVLPPEFAQSAPVRI